MSFDLSRPIGRPVDLSRLDAFTRDEYNPRKQQAIQTALNRYTNRDPNDPVVENNEAGRSLFSPSFNGTNVQATCFIPPNAKAGPENLNIKSFKRFAELQTITLSSNRGIYPVRALGEHWVRDYVKGTRSFAGTIIFSLLETDVFTELYQIDRRETATPYVPFVDQLPPFTIGLHAINEAGRESSMFLYGVTLTNWGMALSVDDLFVETSYNYVAKWATPFMPGKISDNLNQLAQLIKEESNISKASQLPFENRATMSKYRMK